MKKYAEITRDNRMWDAQKTIYGNAAWVKLPDCGTATVIWGENEEGYEHVSVCPKKKYDKLGRENLPTWNDMCILNDMFFYDDEEVYQIHPKKDQYVNKMENCLHLWKPIGFDMTDMVMQKSHKEGEEQWT